nr:DUF637 domain-containing protein [Halomonas ilicicola]
MAGRNIHLEAGRLDNASGMVEASEGLHIHADTLHNNDGDLRALGESGESRLEMAGTFDNDAGRVDIANQDFWLKAKTLLNVQGQLNHAGMGLFNLIAGALTNQDGQVQGAGSGLATIEQVMSIGKWLFKGPLGITLDQALTVEEDERIASADNLSLESTSLNNAGELLANNALSLRTSGDITNRGLISTQGDLTVRARHLTQHDGRLASGDTSTYFLSGTLDNLGRLTGQGNVDIQANYVNNRGTLGSQQDLRIASHGSIDNRPDTLLFSGGDMTLHGKRLFNRYGDIYSQGALNFARDDQNNKADSLENRSGTIEAKRGVSLHTASLLNTKDEFDTFYNATSNYIDVDKTLIPGYRYESGTHQCSGHTMTGPNSCRFRDSSRDKYGYSVAVHELGEYLISKNSADGIISSGGNLTIKSHKMLNSNSNIYANNDIYIFAHSLENSGGGLSSVDHERAYEFTLSAYVTRSKTDTKNETTYYTVPNGDVDQFSSMVAEWNQKGGVGSGGNLLSLPSKLNSNTLKSDVTTITDLDGGESGIIQAGNRVVINAGDTIQNGTINNNTHTQLNGRLGNSSTSAPVNSLEITLNSRTDTSADSPLVGSDAVANYHDAVFARVAPTQLSSFRLPQGNYGLFVRNSSPQSRYLIETNPELTSVDSFLGSGYMLDKLGYTDDGAYKLLGDGRYESRLIRDAVQANTGQRFLDDTLSNDYAQYRYLMDNAVAAKDALQLKVGVGLTPQQTAALTHDIVWMEKQEVEGETVLAPVLYLAQVDARNVRGSSLIQGRDIELIAGGDLINVGTIRASDNLAATSGGTILQGGLVEADDRLALTAQESIRNAMAGEIRGGRVDLDAIDGDIVNDRTAVTAGYEKSYATYLDQGGLISARDSLALTAGRDILNRAEIDSQGDATLLAGRDIANSAVQDTRGGAQTYGRGPTWESTSQLGASIITGGDLALASGRDVVVTASEATAGGALEVNAARDIRLEAGEDTTRAGLSRRVHYDKRSVTQVASRLSSGDDTTLNAGRDVRLEASQVDSGGTLNVAAANDILLASKEDSRSTQLALRRLSASSLQAEQVGSELSAAEDMTLQAGQNVTAIASRVDTDGSLAIQAGNTITLASAESVQSDSFESRAKQKKSLKRRQQGSELTAGNDLSLIAGNDLRLIASQAKAGDEAYLYAGDGVQLLAAHDQDYSLYEKETSGGLFGNSRYRRDEVNDLRAVGSQLASGGDLTVVSGGDQTYQGVRLEAGNDLTLASGGAIHFEAARDLHVESHEKRSGNLAWQSSNGQGRTDETLRQSQLIAQGNLAIQAADGIAIDVKDIDQQTVSQTLDAMVKADPALAWLKAMEARGDVDWQRVKELHDSWDYEQSGLGAGAALAIAIVAIAFVGPAAASLAGFTAGTASFAAVSAGAASLSTTATISTINNGGDLGQAFDDTLSSDSLRGALIAAGSAGLAQGSDQLWGGATDAATGTTQQLDLGSLEGIGRFAGNRATQAIANASLETAFNGGSLGDNLNTNLEGAMAHVASGVLFNAVGDFALEHGWPDGSPQKIALHALSGGLVAEAMGGEFRDGAIAAGANEALVDHLATLVEGDPKLLVFASQLTGIVAAELSGGDVNQGAQIAAQATTYNYLTHKQVDAYAEEAKACEANNNCAEVQEKYRQLSLAQQDDLTAMCATNTTACQQQYQHLVDDYPLFREALDGLGDQDVPWSIGMDAGPLFSQYMEAESAVSQVGFAQHLRENYDLSDEDAALASSAILASMGGVGKYRGVGNAFSIAKSGGKHAGFLKNNQDRPTEELAKGAAKIEKQIALHQAKIKDPAKYVEGWSKLDPRQQEALVNKKWPSDIRRQEEQRDILKGILSERN